MVNGTLVCPLHFINMYADFVGKWFKGHDSHRNSKCCKQVKPKGENKKQERKQQTIIKLN